MGACIHKWNLRKGEGKCQNLGGCDHCWTVPVIGYGTCWGGGEWRILGSRVLIQCQKISGMDGCVGYDGLHDICQKAGRKVVVLILFKEASWMGRSFGVLMDRSYIHNTTYLHYLRRTWDLITVGRCIVITNYPYVLPYSLSSFDNKASLFLRYMYLMISPVPLSLFGCVHLVSTNPIM